MRAIAPQSGRELRAGPGEHRLPARVCARSRDTEAADAPRNWRCCGSSIRIGCTRRDNQGCSTRPASRVDSCERPGAARTSTMSLAGTFGIAARNFTAYPEMPDAKALVDYGVRMEELGFDSLWVWDHILLGVDPNFPIIDSLTLLTAIAARTNEDQARHRHPRSPAAQPGRAREAAVEHGSALGRPPAHGHGVGLVQARVRRGRCAVRSARQDHGPEPRDPHALLDRGHGQGRVRLPQDSSRRDVSEAGAEAAATDPHRRLRRQGAQRAAVTGDGWLTYFYRPESFAKSWEKIRDFAVEGGKDPDTLLNAAQLPIRVGPSRAAVEAGMMEWLGKEWDYASWSESTKDSAILGSVDECVAQLKEHLAVGVQKIIFVPYKYRSRADRDHRERNHSQAPTLGRCQR